MYPTRCFHLLVGVLATRSACILCFRSPLQNIGTSSRIREPLHPRLFELLFSWSDLEEELLVETCSPPHSIDSLRQETTPSELFNNSHLTLFREREGWCPYSERVWLALEYLDVIPYNTIRIDNSGYGPRPSYFRGQTPQIRWPESGKTQGESMDLVNRILDTYGSPPEGSNAATSAHQHAVTAWKQIMPQRSRPSSRAAFLFQMNGQPHGRATFENSLEAVNELLGEGTGGPFFVGDSMGPADICWAPFLERYRYQLPCLHTGLEPNNANQYPFLSAWYTAMDQVPAYICRVKGNAASWRKVLCMAGFGNAGVAPPVIQENMKRLEEVEKAESRELIAVADAGGSGNNIWSDYAATRPYVAKKPYQEAARIIVSNREMILVDTLKNGKGWKSKSHLDAAMLDLANALAYNDDASYGTPESQQLAEFLTERMCVPRDMGCLPAAYIHRHGCGSL